VPDLLPKRLFHISTLTLLVLVAQPSGFVRPGGPRDPVNAGQLAILPASDAEQVAHHIALLLSIQLGHVLVRAHLGSGFCRKNNL